VGLRPPAFLDLVSHGFADGELADRSGEAMATTAAAPFLASDRYQIASQLAFLRAGQPRVYNANFGRRMNQYDLWGGGIPVGRDGIFVMYGNPEPPEQLRAAFLSGGALRSW